MLLVMVFLLCFLGMYIFGLLMLVDLVLLVCMEFFAEYI